MEGVEEIETLWKGAFSAYEKETNRNLTHDSVLRQMKSTHDLLKQIEVEGQAFHDWRNKHRKLWSSLSAFLAPITAINEIAMGAVSSYPPAAAVLGSILYLIKSCEKVANAYDWIERIFAELQEFSERLTLYARSEMNNVLRKKVTAILTFILRIIGRSESLIRKGKFRTQISQGEYLRVTFLGKDDQTEALLVELNHSMKNEQSYVLALTYSAAKTTEVVSSTTKKIAEKTDTDVLRLIDTVESLSTAAKDRKDKEAEKEDDEKLKHTLEDSSASLDVAEQFSTYRRNLLKGTGTWLQEEPLFSTWVDQKAPILWVLGGPGAGKSYLSTWTILRLLDLHDQQPDSTKGVSVGYFYIKENKETLRDPNIILKTVAWQIALVDRLFRKHVANVCKSPRNTITAEETWENLFLGFYGSDRARGRHAIIVLDGLDEASLAARTTLLGLLRNLVAGGGGVERAHIQLAIFGRKTLRADMDFEREEKFIEVSSAKNRDDIDRYIQKRLEDVELLKKLRKIKPNGPQQANKTGKRIKKKVLDGADGVFLWAKLLLDQITKKDLTQIEKILANPPPNLDEMIWSVFERLAKDQDMDHESVRKMLAWVAYARRPLLFGEIDLILSLPARRPNLLLWASLRGRFASIIHLKFPKGYNPEEEDYVDKLPTQIDLSEGDQHTQEDEDAKPFDFTSNDDEDEEEEEIAHRADSEVLSAKANRGLGSIVAGNLLDDKDESLHIFSDGQVKTIVTFSHQRIRDFIVREGSSETRTMEAMDVYPNTERAELDIALTCLEILRTGLALQPDTRYLVDYAAKNFFWHLEKIDTRRLEDEDKEEILRRLYWLFHESAGVKSLLIAAGDGEDDGYDVFWRTWLSSNTHTKAIQTWFGQNKNLASRLGGEANLWMAAASKSTRELLRPLAAAAAAQWLTKTGYDSQENRYKSEFQVWVIHGYLGMDEEGALSNELKNWAWYKCKFDLISPQRLQHLAEWAKLEKTTHWHAGLGWIMMEGHYYEQAIANFKDALHQDSDAWVAKEGLARCLGEQGNYKEAIEWLEKAIECLPSSLHSVAGFLYPHIADWKRAMGDKHGAFEAASRAYKADWGIALAQLRYLEALDATESFDAIIKVLEELDSCLAGEKDYSYLVRFLVLGNDAYDEIGKACRVGGKPQFVLTAMDRALSLVDQSDNEDMKSWLPAQIAAFRYDYYDQVDEPMLLWETAIKQIDTTDSVVQKSYAKRRRRYSNHLAILLFDAAVAAIEAGLDAALYTTKLKALSIVTEMSADDDDAFDFYGTGYASMLWGRWLRDYQHADEAVWRKCFRARALEEMDMLDDDDASNDTRGLHALAVTLLEAGDRVNAGAIFAILFRPLEHFLNQKDTDGGNTEHPGSEKITPEDKVTDHDRERAQSGNLVKPRKPSVITKSTDNRVPSDIVSKVAFEGVTDIPQSTQSVAAGPVIGSTHPDHNASSKPKTSQLKLQLGNSWMYRCNGCGRDPQGAREMHFCEFCLNKNYCDVCLRKVETGLLWSRQCNPKHTHYRAWPIPSEARDMAAEWVEGEASLRQEWLENLRKKWMK